MAARRPAGGRAAPAARKSARRSASPGRNGSGTFVPGFEPLANAFEQRLARALRERADGPARVGQALRYAALSPGKRVRPLLVLAACDAVGGLWGRALPAAVAVECVHAFSLVHDDLPAMDDDDYRRGRLTTHKKFGDALGVLTGDALLAFAFEELSRLAGEGVPAARVVEAVGRLAHAAGQVTDPEEAEDDRDRSADRRDQLGVDHEAYEDDDDTDREADRPQRRRWQVRLLVERLVLGVGTRLLRLHQGEVLSETPELREGN